ncbi:hypothetical protein ACQKWADRAFT_289576 [Trichoderma austrokoningii]
MTSVFWFGLVLIAGFTASPTVKQMAKKKDSYSASSELRARPPTVDSGTPPSSPFRGPIYNMSAGDGEWMILCHGGFSSSRRCGYSRIR